MVLAAFDMFEFFCAAVCQRVLPAVAICPGCYPVFMCLFCLPQRGKGDRFAVDEVYFSLLNFLLIVSFLVSAVRKKKRHQKKKDRFSFFLV